MARSKKTRRKTSRPARKARARTRKTASKRAKSSRRPKAAARKAKKRGGARRQVRRASRKASTRRAAKPARRKVKATKPKKQARNTQQAVTREGPILNRIRRLLADEERLGVANAVRVGDHLNASAHSGREALRQEMSRHTESSPTLTAGDVDAKWQDAYAVGDEAPGGDNPTPDQDRVDDIGRALGIQYQDNEELRGGEEVLERDRHRWEMDPASSDDWPHDKK